MNDSPEIKVVLLIIILPYTIKTKLLFKYRYIVCNQ